MAPTLVEPFDLSPMSAAGAELRQLIEDHREQAEEGHERLRRDFRALDDRLERLTHDHLASMRRIERIEQTPVNVEKVAWTTRQLLIIVMVALSLGGGMWQLHADMASQAKLQDERNSVLEKQIAAALAESRLNGIKTDDLSKQLTTYLVQHTK